MNEKKLTLMIVLFIFYLGFSAVDSPKVGAAEQTIKELETTVTP